MNKLLLIGGVLAVSAAFAADDCTKWVDPFIGCADNGHCFAAATYPLGLVQPGPDTGNETWDYCSGYRYADDVIKGFSQTHVSGTGCSDLGDMRLMPFVGEARETYDSAYDKATQVARPGYYAVTLKEGGIKVRIAPSAHVATYSFTYPEAPARVFLDTQYGILTGPVMNEHVLESDVRVESPRLISGRNRVKHWVDREYSFVVEFDRDFTVVELPKAAGAKAPKFLLTFPDVKPGDELKAKIAFSTTSVAAAKANLAAEVPAWDFCAVACAARAAWEKLLSRAEVLQGTDAEKTAFYTALYHLFIHPNNIADVDGSYRGADRKVASVGKGHAYYSTLSTWDTFRAAHPLYTILAPEIVDDFVNTCIAHQRAAGFVPIWTLWGYDNQCMIGTHSVPAMVDAWAKGFTGFDAEAAYQAIRASLREKHGDRFKEGWELLDKYGYLPFDAFRGESVSRTLECAYDDWCAAKMARGLGHEEDAAFFAKRAQNYRNLFDREKLLMRGRNSKGEWRTPFKEFELGHGADMDNDYTEGNAWQYTWHVMQDPEGLISLFGGKEKFGERLDTLFKLPETIDGEGFVGDVSGLIGQYAHGNEPSHHTIYFFQYAGMPRRTAELVREVFDKFYLTRPDGLCGNDDCGQMSAWYVFSALGFYPFNPCGEGYVLGAPQIAQVRLTVPGGKQLTVTAKNLSRERKYVRSVTLNGRPVEGFRLSHEQVLSGGELVFEMGE